jgi:hypothetical protein
MLHTYRTNASFYDKVFFVGHKFYINRTRPTKWTLPIIHNDFLSHAVGMEVQ